MVSTRPKENVTRGKEYFAANALTVTRAGLGLTATILGVNGHLAESAVVCALALPTEFDGRIARKHNVDCLEGAVRDTLADACWFDGMTVLLAVAMLRALDGDPIQLLFALGFVSIIAFNSFQTVSSAIKTLNN